MKDFFVAYEALKSSFEKNFQEIIKKSSLGKAPISFQDAVHYSLFTGGKKIRASLVLEISHIYLLKPKTAMLLAGAIECLHTYSLVHDDLPAMDDDDFRRGMQSSHKRYDEATAILVGDALQALSFELLAESGCPPNVVHYFSQAAGGSGMVGGQFMDIRQNKKVANREKVPIKTLNHINFLKTGRLFQASTSLPLRFIHAQNTKSPKNIEERVIHACENWGNNFGLLFQIMDDLEEEKSKEGSQEASKKMGVHSKSNRSLNISDIISVEETWKIAKEIEKKLSEESSYLFPRSTFLNNISNFVFTRVKQKL